MITKTITGYVFQCQKCKECLYGRFQDAILNFQGQFVHFFNYHFLECSNHAFPITVVSNPDLLKSMPSLDIATAYVVEAKFNLHCQDCGAYFPLNPILENTYNLGSWVCDHYWQCKHYYPFDENQTLSHRNRFIVKDASHFGAFNNASAAFVAGIDKKMNKWKNDEL